MMIFYSNNFYSFHEYSNYSNFQPIECVVVGIVELLQSVFSFVNRHMSRKIVNYVVDMWPVCCRPH